MRMAVLHQMMKNVKNCFKKMIEHEYPSNNKQTPKSTDTVRERDKEMREILFRAKRIDNGEWVEGFYTQLPKPSLGATIVAGGDLCAEDVSDYIITNKSKQHSNFSNSYPLEIVECEQYEVDPETVCQYAGYKDDTGRSIFEGDIVNFTDGTSTESGFWETCCCGKVGYDEEEACFYVTNRLSAESWEVLGECHIIGNIFDNQELKV